MSEAVDSRTTWFPLQREYNIIISNILNKAYNKHLNIKTYKIFNMNDIGC